MLSRASGKGAAAVALTLLGSVLMSAPAPAAHADDIRDRQRPVLKTLDMTAAWKLSRGRGATVAVIDSGVDPGHADLRGAVTTGPNMLRDIDQGSRPKRIHGTGMASLIAGRGHGAGDRDGVIGVAPQSRILAVRALAEPGDESYRRYRRLEEYSEADTVLGNAIRYAVDHGADVINLSLGNHSGSDDERKAIGHAIAKGVVVVAAVGNDGAKRRSLDRDGFAPYTYPAAYPGVVAVAATDSRHRRADFSNQNYSVLVSAPGTEVAAASPGDEYVLTDGTSDATALVSGIVALIRARHPKLPPALVTQALLAGTRHGPTKTYDPAVGFGEVNAARAVRAADRLVGPRPESAFGKSGGQRFGSGDQEPVKVIDRPFWVRPIAVAIILICLGGTAIAATVLTLLYRRTRSLPP